MTERIEVVLSDIDGTQIIPGQKLPSPQVQAAARGLRKNNVSLLEVTSRSHVLVRELVVPLDLQNNLATLDGGATVAHTDSGDIVWSRWLSAEHTKAVVAGIGRLCTSIYYDTDSRRRSPSEVAAAVESGDISSTPSVFAIFGVERGSDIIATLGSLAGIRHTPVMGYNNSDTLRCIQVVCAGVDKQSGIEEMLRHGNLIDRRKLAIGDGMNDIALFAAAGDNGVRVAMGNAPDELKDLADWVAPPVEEYGFAVAMERYGLSI
ncbi:MAG TPA: HAD family hydrolase [Verrucomicrobiae bacterium]|nr:HAD family hydrolase [Verrucomicrobiae bacterium]